MKVFLLFVLCFIAYSLNAQQFFERNETDYKVIATIVTVNDSVVTNYKIYNLRDHDVIILADNKFNVRGKGCDGLWTRINSDVSNDPLLVPKMPVSFCCLKPNEYYEVSQSFSCNIKDVKRIAILFSLFDMEDFEKKCQKKIRKAISNNKNSIEISCLVAYINNMYVRFDVK